MWGNQPHTVPRPRASRTVAESTPAPGATGSGTTRLTPCRARSITNEPGALLPAARSAPDSEGTRSPDGTALAPQHPDPPPRRAVGPARRSPGHDGPPGAGVAPPRPRGCPPPRPPPPPPASGPARPG